MLTGPEILYMQQNKNFVQKATLPLSGHRLSWGKTLVYCTHSRDFANLYQSSNVILCLQTFFPNMSTLVEHSSFTYRVHLFCSVAADSDSLQSIAHALWVYSNNLGFEDFAFLSFVYFFQISWIIFGTKSYLILTQQSWWWKWKKNQTTKNNPAESEPLTLMQVK